MDSSNKERKPLGVILRGRSIEELQSEIGEHLTRVMQRQPKTAINVSYKIPLGFGGPLEAGQSICTTLAFPLSGTLANFMSVLPPSAGDVFIKLTATSQGITQVLEQRLQDGERSYSLEITVPRLSHAKLEITNKGKTTVDAVVGFTFQETMTDEIKVLGLIGSL